MKNEAVRLPLIAAAVFALLPLAGCSSGGGTSPVSNQVALSSTIPSTSPTRVTVVANYDTPGQAVINVTFPADQTVSIEDTVEYHVYRNDMIVGRFLQAEVRPLAGTPGQTLRFIDGNHTFPVDYQTITPIPVGIVQARSMGVAPFSAQTPLVYRITLISGAVGIEGQKTFTETEIGRSNTITPFR